MTHLLLFLALVFPIPDAPINEAFGGREGTLVLIDCASGEVSRFNPGMAAKKLPPCSTFKIWNTLFGLEAGILHDADEPFYKWDGVKRSIEGWNQDLTLRGAFRESCVPAYQALARKIGEERMKGFLEKISYGDRNTSSGLDVFWLPEPGRVPLLISPDEQAALMVKLATGKVPFSADAQARLKDIMTAKKTERGTLYGKTGTGGDGPARIGWYVGYVESGGKTYAFACVTKGEGVMGKDSRAVVERVLGEGGYL